MYVNVMVYVLVYRYVTLFNLHRKNTENLQKNKENRYVHASVCLYLYKYV